MPDPSPTAVPTPDDAYDSAAVGRARAVVHAMPDHVGRYRILEHLGGGGMGEVYVAEQITPIKRRVALKLIKPGMDTRQVVARFEAERQALAMMDHPNVARVFDAGTTETGRPYFVMELIRGVPITQYCDDNKLTTRQRVELLVPVCQAVQHAHQKGIIHRDLKPTNVLVTLHDGKPVPKVIDFGIAKATGQSLTDKTVYTEFRQMIGTPAYMSPEQAEMSGLDIDTRSDVYSLGVLAYELLTGTTPFDTQRLVKAGLAEIGRIIKEEDPPRPSLRLSTMAEASRTTIAARRGTEPARIGKMVAGELDWIVMKAMEKDRRRRYETANDLAADLGRHLNSEPVTAAAPTWRYRSRKLLAKHRGVVLAGATISVLIGCGLVGTTWGMIQAKRAKAVLQAEATATQHALQNVMGENILTAYPGVFERNPRQMVVETMQTRDGKEYNWSYDFRDSGDVTKGKFNVTTSNGQIASVPTVSAVISDIAVRSMRQEREARDSLVQQRDAAETEAYIANLALAQAAMQADRWPEARQRLDACPSTKRGWEWQILQQKADSIKFSQPRVRNLAITEDRRLFVCNRPVATRLLMTNETVFQVYDSANGEPVGVPMKYPYVLDLPWLSPDGSRLAASTAIAFAEPDSVGRLWNLRTGEPIGPPMEKTAFFAFSGDGSRMLVQPCDNWTAQLFDTTTCKPIGGKLDFDDMGNNAAKFSEDNKLMVTRMADRTVCLWDLVTGQPIGQPLKLGGAAKFAAFGPDSKHVLTILKNHAAQLQLWTTDQGLRSAGPAMHHDGDIKGIAFSPDRAALLTRSEDRTARLWDAQTALPIGQPMAHGGAVTTAEFSRDGSRILTVGNDQTARLWNARTAAPVTQPMYGVTTAAFSPDGALVLTTSTDRNAQLWDTHTGLPIGQSMVHDAAIDSASFSPDGTRVLSNAGGHARLWDGHTGTLIASLLTRDGETPFAQFCPSGTRIVTAIEHEKEPGEAFLWDATSGALLGQRVVSTGRVVFLDRQIGQAMRYEHRFDDNLATDLAVVSLDAFDEPIQEIFYMDEPADLALTADVILAESPTDTPASRTAASQPADLPKALAGAVISPDGTRAVLADNNLVRFFDPKTGRELIAFPFQAAVQRIRFTRDGTRLIVDLEGNTIEIWDTRDYAARQKDRDARFDEIPAARAYVQVLLASNAAADTGKLKDAIRKDESISTLRKLVALEQLDLELAKRQAATRPATTQSAILPNATPTTRAASVP